MQSMDLDRPKVGVGVLLIKNNQVLLAKRKASHGIGEWALPGGHLEYNESFEDCALRELAEETGTKLKVKRPSFMCVTNLRRYMPKHYVDIGMLAEWISGEAENTEPDKKEQWQWFSLDKLPSPLFGCEDNYIEAYKTGRVYFEQ